jgi:hypothetical protein
MPGLAFFFLRGSKNRRQIGCANRVFPTALEGLTPYRLAGS